MRPFTCMTGILLVLRALATVQTTLPNATVESRETLLGAPAGRPGISLGGTTARLRPRGVAASQPCSGHESARRALRDEAPLRCKELQGHAGPAASGSSRLRRRSQRSGSSHGGGARPRRHEQRYYNQQRDFIVRILPHLLGQTPRLRAPREEYIQAGVDRLRREFPFNYRPTVEHLASTVFSQP